MATITVVVESDQRIRKKREKWSKDWYLQRSEFEHSKLLRILGENEPIDLKNFLRMDVQTYDYFLEMIDRLIIK